LCPNPEYNTGIEDIRIVKFLSLQVVTS